MTDNIFALSDEQTAKILDNFINRVECTNRKSGTVFGSYQILGMIDRVAIDAGYIECPHCHQKRNKVKV